MNAEEINEIYQTLAPMSTDYANANIERIGQAQSSYGPLAQAAMGDSQTAGIGNYTYNRLVRPSVDAMRDQLVVEGLSASMNKQISDSLKAAKDNYQRAYKSYARRYGSGGAGGGVGDTTATDEVWDGVIDTESTNSKNVEKHSNNSFYTLFTLETPSGTRVQWKYSPLSGTLDSPTQSYGASAGAQHLREAVQNGSKIYDKNGNDISSRFK